MTLDKANDMLSETTAYIYKKDEKYAMGSMTYEQFEFWCKHWNMTINEGYRAMCFTWNIINQNFANHFEYANKISEDNNNSDAFKKIAEKSKEDATILKVFYSSLESEVFNMLEKHDMGKYAWRAIMSEAEGFDTVEEAYLDACAYLERGY